ncbi:MAG: response regulator [Gluconacetobacter diazotrophicus]|nr:response regulator [Gluconacetobacter diazotrophicus]
MRDRTARTVLTAPHRLAAGGGAAASCFAALVLLAWLLGRSGPSWLFFAPAEVSPPTALGCLVAGLLVAGRAAGTRPPRLRAPVLPLLLLCGSLFLFAGDLLTGNRLLDPLVSLLPGARLATVPTRMASATALSLALVAGALLLRAPTGPAARLRVFLLVAALLAASLGLLGYAYGIEGLRRHSRFRSMSLPVSIELAALALSALALESAGGWGLLFSRGGQVARTSRRQVLLAVAVPFVSGLAVLPLLRHHVLTPGVGMAAVVASTILPLVAQSLRDGRRLDRLAVQLELRVAERTASLLASQNRLRTYFDYAPEGLLLIRVTADGGMLFEAVSRSFRLMYGLGDRELENRSVLSFTSPDDTAEIGERIAASLRRSEPVRYTARRRIGGEERLFDVLFVSVPPDPDTADRFVAGSIRDITDASRREEQLRQSQKMEAVGQLTGGIAHDFNNLLTGITGSLELVGIRLRQGRPEAIPRHLATAQDAADRAASLTHRLLAFSRRQTLDPRPVRLAAIVDGMMPLIRRSVGPGVAISVRDACGNAATLADPNQLENALLNLCLNAADAMPEGGSLRIACEPLDLPGGPSAPAAATVIAAEPFPDLRPGRYVVLRVSDDGVGMTPDVVRHAVEPFFTTKPLGRGTGLGLSMIYGFARQSDGGLRIDSAPGAGTTVSLFLPRQPDADAPAPEAPHPAAAAAAAPAHRPGARILVVDDEDAVRELVAEALGDAGYRVSAAADAAGAIELIRGGAFFDLLVSDVGLPGGTNGRQLADAARAMLPRLPVLFITGYAEATAFRGQLAPGMSVLPKPFGLSTLLERVSERLETAVDQSAATATRAAATRAERSDASSM